MYLVALEERRQGLSEKFDKFYISLKRLENAANVCGTCVDARMATRIMEGIRDADTTNKLLTIDLIPTAQDIVQFFLTGRNLLNQTNAL